MKNTSISIWDDSECTLEDEYSSPVSCNSPNHTKEFRNTLISNKGNIRDGKIQQNEFTIYESTKNQKAVRKPSMSVVDKSDYENMMNDLKDSEQMSVIIIKPTRKAKKHDFTNVDNKKSWQSVRADIIRMTSFEILKDLRS